MKKLNIIIPTINRKDLLMEALIPINKQLDQFEKLLIIDNGKQDIKDSIRNLELVKQDKVEIFIPENNLGVGPSWNYGIQKFRDSEYLLFLNDDIVISDSQLYNIQDYLTNTPDFWLLTGDHFWSMFMLSRTCWEYFLKQDGYVFDPSYYPAYFEDNDMHYRITLAYENIYNKKIAYPNNMHIGSTEMDPAVFRNSMTIKKDPKINSGFGKNQTYFVRKWGGMPGHEKFKTPFNK
jgi:GT2 family glycosyltransferase